ncbi:mannose-1-phosphate guanylyltransferase [Granulicella cerasi]|uniref:Mannose-1-phosphate guanylyltransferase n=1 Tax=Granulicella cerasi TaxID=741063 RepID=A0ABW1Z6M0_9BACT|nr:mannose-1-phosphate guanylyltransferase [Granulicella cerasi]
MANTSKPVFAPVILAGGSGTRFWPRSRRARAKQVLALEGTRTMIQDTLDRLRLVAEPSATWVITNGWLREVIVEQLPEVTGEHVVSEPCARNTAPACALAAFLLERTAPETVLGVFPSDHVVANPKRFAEVLAKGIEIAAAGENIVVLGVPPTRPETGYGYIEQGALYERVEQTKGFAPISVHRVRRFREKPDLTTAERFLAAGNFVWNGGIFLWSAKTLCAAIREYTPEMAEPLEKIAAAYGTPEFEKIFAAEYPKCENISVDYAVLERRSARGEQKANIFCLPADFGWNDLGSWASLYEHRAEREGDNVIDGGTTGVFAIQATGNYVYAPGKTVALLGVDDLVVVETDDALLITTLGRSQDVSKLVRAIHEGGREDLI